MSQRVNKFWHGQFLTLVLGGVFLNSILTLATDEILYVNSEKTQLRSEPQITSSALVEIPRGTALVVLKRDGIWFQVSTQTQDSKTGWVSKLFVSSRKPVGEAQVSHLASDSNLSKTSRRRASSYSVSASTRGLSAESKRSREGRDSYQTDFSSVEKMEKKKIDQNELRNFKNQGKLNE